MTVREKMVELAAVAQQADVDSSDFTLWLAAVETVVDETTERLQRMIDTNELWDGS